MLKFLDTTSFGDFASLIWIINLLAVVTTGFGLFLVKEFSKSKDVHQDNSIIYISIKYGLIVSSILFAIYILFSWILWSYLNIDSIYLVIIAGSWILLSFTALYQNSYYQARKYFSFLSFLQFLNPVLRILLWWIFIWMWYGVMGWILGFILPFYILFFIRFFHIKALQKSESNKKIIQTKELEENIVKDFLSQKKQIFQFLITSIIMALLMNIDILIIKNMFDWETAGYYAAVSVLAKFLVFLWLSVETVYYPQLVKEKIFPTKKILQISWYYALLTLGALWFFYLFGEIVLSLFKEWLQDYIVLIYPLLIFGWLLGYTSIIVKTLIAFEYYLVNYLLWWVIIALVVSIYTLWNSPEFVTILFAIFWFVWLIASSIYMYYIHHKNLWTKK